MSNLALVTVLCTDTNICCQAEVLQKSTKYLKVVFVDTMSTLELFKRTPDDNLYRNELDGLHFQSTGN